MNENNEMNNKKKSTSYSVIIITILIIAILGLIIGIAGYKFGWFSESTQNNTIIAESKADSGENATNDSNIEAEKNNNKNNTGNNSVTSDNTINNTNGNINVNEKNIKKIDIDDNALVEILKYEEPFSNGQSLGNQRYLQIVYNAINEGYVVFDEDRNADSGESKVKYTENEINSIIYTIFGVTLTKNENFGSVMNYKDGVYTIEFSDRGTPAIEAKNIEGDVAAGTRYITFDLALHDYVENDNTEDLGSYAIGIRGEDGFVTSYRKLSD